MHIRASGPDLTFGIFEVMLTWAVLMQFTCSCVLSLNLAYLGKFWLCSTLNSSKYF